VRRKRSVPATPTAGGRDGAKDELGVEMNLPRPTWGAGCFLKLLGLVLLLWGCVAQATKYDDSGFFYGLGFILVLWGFTRRRRG
jgi:hypothetical protein